MCPDCQAPLRPAGSGWYCHACLGECDDDSDDGTGDAPQCGLSGTARALAEAPPDEVTR